MTDGDGLSPIACAIRFEHADCVQLLQQEIVEPIAEGAPAMKTREGGKSEIELMFNCII